MKDIKKYLLIVMGVVAMASCTTQKKLTYFRGLDSGAADSINAKRTLAHETQIMNGDMMTITVSALSAEAAAPFNMPLVSYASTTGTGINTTPYMQSYLVDVNGNISFPMLGLVHVAGLKKSEAVALLQEKISAYVQNPIVTINFTNLHVSVLGEVNRPGQYTIANERATLLDVLSMAGDLTPYGRRENVLVTREVNGKMEFYRLNLNSTEVYSSPFYYMQQNDVIYVEPNKVRAVASQNISLYLSMLTTIASLATVIVSVVKK